MTKKRAIDIIKLIDRTLKVTKWRDMYEGTCNIIKSPRAKKKDLIKKKNEIKKKYNL
tara:strand:- start:467 stop:637 length:171 start_codon:yes stop_codon:yes gene_type:complete